MTTDSTTPDPAFWQACLERFQELLAVGGPVMAVIAALSVLAFGVLLFKLLQFGYLRVGARAAIDRALAAWRSGNGDQALALLAGSRNPAARTLHRAIQGKLSDRLDRQDLEREVTRHANAQIVHLRSYLGLLELIATLAPLLGLLGTVLGMIEAFQALEAAGSRVNPALLSGGIWTALLTTAAGLTVAIPAAAAHKLLEAAVERVADTMEDAAGQVLATAFDGPAAEATIPPARPRLATEMAS